MPDITEPTAAPAAEPTPMSAVEAAIGRWFNAHIADSPVARSVDAYNHLRSVLAHLHSEITAAIAKEI